MLLGIDLLLDLISEMSAFSDLINRFKVHKLGDNPVVLLDSAKPYLVAALYRKLNIPILLITARPDSARRISEQIAFWSAKLEPKLFLEPDVLFYQRTLSDDTTEQERLKVLSSLHTAEKEKPPLVVSSVQSLIHKTITQDIFAAACFTLNTGIDADPLNLLKQLERLGYRFEHIVEVPGFVSHRGGIIDIFPVNTEYPIRLEFFGNTIESIRMFDPGTQRSQNTLSQVNISPASEFLLLGNTKIFKDQLNSLDLDRCSIETREKIQEEISLLAESKRIPGISFYSGLLNSGNLLDYFYPDSLIILDDPVQLKTEIFSLDNHADEFKNKKLKTGELPPNYPKSYFTWEEIQSRLQAKNVLNLSSWIASEDDKLPVLGFSKAPSYAGQLPLLINSIGNLLKQKKRLIVISNQAGRISELLEEKHIYSQPVKKLDCVPPLGALSLVQSSLSEGWIMGETYLLTDKEIFGFIKEQRLWKQRPVTSHKMTVDIKSGDHVVHVEHGIGQFLHIINLSTDSTEKEYLVLSYAAGDKLYVPSDQIDRVSRYIGAGERTPVLSRLGTQEWSRTKQKVKESVQEIARDLLQLYAARETVSGYSFSPDTVWQQELEASFPYIETPDQIKVQEEIKADMSRPKPMDRLVIGDVGYGKTEIAIRAAFKAVLDNKQVAVLVPTTVLAEQHFQTFKQRMGAFPVKIEVLSRFCSQAEQKSIITGLAGGAVDICIGTHRLLQKDVVFKELGLLVIDEEQRFGVSHKEHFKKMRQQVDVLTLSATPIPRSLHMSLVGVRDMSIIETPPENRLPIKTFIAEYEDQLVRESILRELERNGQVFFVHNRVQGINILAAKLRSLVPEARLNIAHGQMPEERLESVMVSFQQGETNLLVCTTIIESGLDLPNVNTIIVNQADKFGLTQLYQLRGRIGRGSNLAYAYFIFDKNKRLTPAAEQRLRTIFEAADLGAGFGIAMKDLEIRGAGTLLGTRQSGNISAVGFNMYTQLLSQAVEDLKSDKSGIKRESESTYIHSPAIDLPLKSYIPDTYIPDVDIRLSIYHRITGIITLEKVEDLSAEMQDRFGKYPPEVGNLFFVIRLKTLCLKANVEAITTNGNIVTIRLLTGRTIDRHKLQSMSRFGITVGVTKLIVNLNRLGKDWQKYMEEIIRAIT